MIQSRTDTFFITGHTCSGHVYVQKRAAYHLPPQRNLRYAQEKKAVFLRFLKVPGINCITTVKPKI